jgi:hypothetical protein
MHRRTFLKSAAAASAAALLRPSFAEAALPQAKITRIRFYEAPGVMPLQIPLLQSNMVVTIETDANITGIGEGGTRDTLEPCAGRLIGKNPFHIERCWLDMFREKSKKEFDGFKGIQILARKDLATNRVELKYEFAFGNREERKIVEMVKIDGAWRSGATRGWEASWDAGSAPEPGSEAGRIKL